MINIYKLIVILLLVLSVLILQTSSFSAEDINKGITAFQQEIKSAQNKLDKAKKGDTLQEINLPVSINNMQKLLSSLMKGAGDDKKLLSKLKVLNDALNSLEVAKNKNDKAGTQKILNEMASILKTLEVEAKHQNIAPIQAQANTKGPPMVTGKDTPSLLKVPTPSLNITSFTKCPDTMTGLIAPGASSLEPTSTTINIGEEVCLSWRIEGCNVDNVTARLSPGIPETVEPGTRVDEGQRCFRMANHKRVRPTDTTTYTLSVGFPGMPRAATSKTFTVNVKRPRLEVLQPEVNLRDLRVRFFTTNNGELDIESVPVTVQCRVVGISERSGRIWFENINFTTSNMTIRRGQRVELGERSLPNRSAFSPYSAMDLEVSVSAGTVTSRWSSFSYSLAPTESSISSTLFGSAITGEIRLNNFDRSVTSNTVRRIPRLRSDSYIIINENRRRFDIDYISLRVTVGSTSRRYLGFINNLTAPVGGRDFVSFADGKLKMHIVFDTGSGRQIKGWLQDIWDPDVWNDEQGPYIDIRRLEIDVFLTLALRDGRITYTDVQIEPSVVNLSVAGGWEFINPLVRERLQNIFRDEIRTYLSELLMSDSMRRNIEDAVANNLRTIGIYRIETLRVERDRLILTYYR